MCFSHPQPVINIASHLNLLCFKNLILYFSKYEALLDVIYFALFIRLFYNRTFPSKLFSQTRIYTGTDFLIQVLPKKVHYNSKFVEFLTH